MQAARLTAGYIFLPSGCRLRIVSMSAAVREETGMMRLASSPARRFLRISLKTKGRPTTATSKMRDDGQDEAIIVQNFHAYPMRMDT